MNTETQPAGTGPLERQVTPLDVFCAADDALTYLERPFYRACAGGAHFERTPEWERKRAELTRQWLSAYAAVWPPKAEPAARPLLARLAAWLGA